MEKHDDAPTDVKRATPVDREIKRGQKDDTFEGYPRLVEKKKRWEHCDKPSTKRSKQAKKSNEDCCQQGRERKKKTPKFAMVSVFEEPCSLPKVDIVPRHCLTKQKYIDMLAEPSRKCPPDCRKRTVRRRLKPVSTRIKELAQPARQRMLMTLQQGAATLPPAFLDNLVRTLENETCLTPEQAAVVSRKKKYIKKKKGRKNRWQFKETNKSRKSSVGVASTGSTFDRESVSCQYLIAERFVRSVLKWKCPVPKVEFNDISEVIVARLIDALDYIPSQEEDRKSQQLHFLADAIACWVTGVLSEVAERQEQRLLERCQRKRDEIKADEEMDEEEDIDEDAIDVDEDVGEDEDYDYDDKRKDEDKGDEDAEKEDKEESVREGEEDMKDEEGEEEERSMEEEEEEVMKTETEMQTDRKSQVEVGSETQDDLKIEAETETKPEMDTEEAITEEVARRETATETEITAELEAESEEKLSMEEIVDEIEEPPEVKEEELEIEEGEKEEEEGKVETEEATEMDKLKSKESLTGLKAEVTDEIQIPKDIVKDLNELFKTDLPFLTFGKIIDTVYKMIESTPENTGKDPITNGIHRAIYEKLYNIVMLENPELLTEELQNIMDVVCGKIANWLRSMLSKSQLAFMNQFVSEVESKEIRDWTKWLSYINDVAKDWNLWLRSVIEEMFEMESAPITRGEWRDWTRSVDTKALLWRRFYLQIRHQAQRNVVDNVGRRVVKTGARKPIAVDGSEQLLLTTDLHA